MQARLSNSERTQETRAALISAARALFLDKGFVATGTPELVDRAGVTRGALYHHYKDKQDLFRAVVEAEAQEIAREIESGSGDAPTGLDALLSGARSYFEAMRKSGRARLMLLEGPAVLGVTEMRRIDLQTGGRELRIGLAHALGPGFSDAEIDARADLVSAMFDRATLACEAGADRKLYEDAITAILSNLVRDGSR